MKKGVAIKILKSFNTYFTLSDLRRKIKERGLKIDRVTIYRNLKYLIKMGMVKEIYTGKSEKYYEYIGKDSKVKHHHHIICLSCNRLVDFKLSIFEQILKLNELIYSRIFKFKVKFHNIDFYGFCQKCYNKNT